MIFCITEETNPLLQIYCFSLPYSWPVLQTVSKESDKARKWRYVRMSCWFRCYGNFLESFARLSAYSQTEVRYISEFIVNKLLFMTTRRGGPKKRLLIQVWKKLKKSHWHLKVWISKLHLKVWMIKILFQGIQNHQWVSHQINNNQKRKLIKYHQLEQNKTWCWERSKNSVQNQNL